MTYNKVSLKGYNFFQKKYGQRNHPYIYFYLTPLIGYSRTTRDSIHIHIGWLYFTLLIQFKK